MFVFEGPEVEWIVNELIDDPAIASYFAPWQKLIDGTPRLAHERFYWSRADEKLGVGPGRLARFLGQQPVRECVAHELGAGRQPQLLHDVSAVRLRRAHRDVELLGDLLIRVAEREQP